MEYWPMLQHGWISKTCKWKKPVIKGPPTAWSHLHETVRIGRSMETKRRLVAARGWGEKRTRRNGWNTHLEDKAMILGGNMFLWKLRFQKSNTLIWQHEIMLKHLDRSGHVKFHTLSVFFTSQYNHPDTVAVVINTNFHAAAQPVKMICFQGWDDTPADASSTSC